MVAGRGATLRTGALVVVLMCGLALAGYAAGGLTGLLGMAGLLAVISLVGRGSWGKDPGGAMP
ncbi:hypothetical protein JOF53_003299 [Crossiella equi]|uniref:Uncharacterized protein n=1 Tax=Crossiella equi TaxID=130796 RepID=A0ABS5ACV8_9PSEU|nr:hypothetical protein [Crossiella equi]MBP2474427.1 hypothetical protein [Crossiella equi]